MQADDTRRTPESQPLPDQMKKYFRECYSQAIDILEREVERLYPHNSRYDELLDPKYDWEE